MCFEGKEKEKIETECSGNGANTDEQRPEDGGRNEDKMAGGGPAWEKRKEFVL